MGKNTAGTKFATLISATFNKLRDNPIISSDPTQFISAITASLRYGATTCASIVIAPWYTNTDTAESITPTPSVAPNTTDEIASNTDLRYSIS